MQRTLDELKKIFDCEINNPGIIEEALTHPSVNQKRDNKEIKTYERLELFGDSILGFVITEMLFHKYQNHDEGDLAKIKSHLVSNSILSSVAQDIGLAEFIIMTEGEEKTGGRENPNNLENVLEALIAAIYLDGKNIDVIRKVVNRFWNKYMQNLDANEIDPKTYLQEITQKHFSIAPQYNVISKTGPAHMPYFVVELIVSKYKAQGEGTNIKMAEKNAAKKLLAQLDLKGI